LSELAYSILNAAIQTQTNLLNYKSIIINFFIHLLPVRTLAVFAYLAAAVHVFYSHWHDLETYTI